MLTLVIPAWAGIKAGPRRQGPASRNILRLWVSAFAGIVHAGCDQHYGRRKLTIHVTPSAVRSLRRSLSGRPRFLAAFGWCRNDRVQPIFGVIVHAGCDQHYGRRKLTIHVTPSAVRSLRLSLSGRPRFLAAFGRCRNDRVQPIFGAIVHAGCDQHYGRRKLMIHVTPSAVRSLRLSLRGRPRFLTTFRWCRNDRVQPIFGATTYRSHLHNRSLPCTLGDRVGM